MTEDTDTAGIIEIKIDGKFWETSGDHERDASLVITGALLAGAETIVFQRKGGSDE